MDEGGNEGVTKTNRNELAETHRYATNARIRLNGESNNEASPVVKRKLQVTIDPSAFAKPCSTSSGVMLREKNSGSFPNTPQVLRRAEIIQGILSVNNSPVVSRRSELISDGISVHCASPFLTRRSDLFVQNDSACSSASNSPLVHRRFENGIRAFGSPARSIGEPGVFNSPAHSSASVDDDDNDVDFGDLHSDQTVVSGWLKFRDNKRWKQRWGVVNKLSPAADCLHLQLYRDSKDRYKKGQTKASLSLQHFLGFESGFTLDKESNTIAIICQDVIVVLAFDTRERLIQWQVKISTNLGEGQQFLVLISSAPPKTKTSTGPAKLHIQDHRFCLTAGVPPRLIGIWEIVSLRRYGVVEGRFCFEGGSRCGKGEGLHVLITDQGDEITHTFALASQGKLSTKKRTLIRKMSNADSPKKQMSFRPETRLSDLTSMDTNQEMSRSIYGDENCCVHNNDDIPCGTISPYWPSVESQNCHHGDIDSNYGCGDTASVSEMHDAVHHDAWPGGPGGVVTLERCMSCISKLGAMSRSSTVTAAMTPCAGSHFHPAWTMESLKEKNDRSSVSSRNSSGGSTEYSTPRLMNNSTNQDILPQTPSSPTRSQLPSCNCPNCPPARPPKMLPLGNLNLNSQTKSKKPAMPLPVEPICNCQQKQTDMQNINSKVGPYENYDIPKPHFPEDKKADVKNDASTLGEHYDTPKKIKECLAMENIFQLTKSSLPGIMTLKKPCGCILKLGRRAPEPMIIDCEDVRPPYCPCQRVTNWANSLISLPYCRKISSEEQNQNQTNNEDGALYATVDVSKKTNRKNTNCICRKDDLKNNDSESDTSSSNYVNIDPSALLPEGTTPKDPPTVNYANLDFAHSLEYYENAKDMLKKAGITKDELESLQNSLNSMSMNKPFCHKCGHHQHLKQDTECPGTTKNDDYLLMKPASSNKSQNNVSGYTPMSPATNINPSNKLPLKARMNRLIVEKSASNPTLFGPPVDRSKKRSESEMRIPGSAMIIMLNSPNSPYTRKQIMDSTDSIEMLKNRKRSSSADSSRYLEDLKEFDSVSSRTTSSSLETLRNISLDNRRSSSPCIHQETENCGDKSCCMKVQYEVKSMDTDGDVTPNGIPVLRKKGREMSHIRRSSSVPCKSGPNRDSSSSNDSGVSTCSLKHHGADFAEFELPLTTSMSSRRHIHALAQRQAQGSHISCLHASLPRKSKSSDPLRDLTFQFQKIIIPAKSSSAEAEVPVCPTKPVKGVIDSHSSSSGASDMSDYIETLSMSSHSSSDTPETLRINRQTNTLRPRSGKEYHSIDQTMLSAHPTDARITGWI